MASDFDALVRAVERALPDPVARAAQLAALADSLTYVQTTNPKIWLVHVLADRIRLFAGHTIVLTLQRSGVWLTTDASADEDQLSALDSWAWETSVYPIYKRPPSRNGTYSPMRDAHGEWPVIQTAHFAYLDRVLERPRTFDPRSVRRHEPLIVEYLSLTLQRSITGVQSTLPLRTAIVSDATGFWEGSALRVPVTRFERDRSARDQCIRLCGTSCAICGMSFGRRYGPEMDDFIHVHHLIPLSEIREGYSVDPAQHLVPVCPNCHAVLHSTGGTVRSVEEVREMLRRQRESCEGVGFCDPNKLATAPGPSVSDEDLMETTSSRVSPSEQ